MVAVDLRERERRSARRIAWLAALVAVAVIALVVFHLRAGWLRRRENWWHRHPKRKLKALQLVCLAYRNEWGTLPWDPRGEAEALYRLKMIVRRPNEAPDAYNGADLFDPATDSGQDLTGPAFFSDATKRLVGCDVEYVNEPTPGDCTVILADQWWVSDRERCFVVKYGHVGLWPVPFPGDRTRLVGMIYDPKTGELHQPEESAEEQDTPPPPTTP